MMRAPSAGHLDREAVTTADMHEAETLGFGEPALNNEAGKPRWLSMNCL